MTSDELGRKLDALADRVERLRPLNHDPESYFVERDEIRAELKRLAAQLVSSWTPAAAERGSFTPGTVKVEGRDVRVERRGARRRPDSEARKVFG